MCYVSAGAILLSEGLVASLAELAQRLDQGHVPALLLDQLFCARIVWAEKSSRDATLKDTFEKVLEQGHKPYLVPYGGSNATGALGYAFAMEEFMGQAVKADWILFYMLRISV